MRERICAPPFVRARSRQRKSRSACRASAIPARDFTKSKLEKTDRRSAVHVVRDRIRNEVRADQVKLSQTHFRIIPGRSVLAGRAGWAGCSAGQAKEAGEGNNLEHLTD